jgi:GPH family glycoside/pentoside/hexuronide:cation symporter
MVEQRTASLSTKLYYGSGAAAFGIKDAGFNYFLLAYYNLVLGLDPFWTGLALALAVVIDAVSDLAVGYMSDNWRSSLGRRHPFMYAAAIPVAVSFVLLWNPPAFALSDETSLFTYLLIMTVLVRSSITFFEVPNAAQGPELTSDYHDRTRLMGFRYLFGWLGGLVMAVLSFMILFELDPAGQLGPTGYQWLGIIGAGAMFVAMLVSSAGTHRLIPGFYKPTRRDNHSVRLVLNQFRSLFKNTSFNSVFTSSLFFGAAAGMSQALTIYVSSFFWLLESTEIGMIPLLGLIAVPTAFYVAPRLSFRWGKKNAAMSVYAFAILFLPLAYLFKLAGFFPDRESALFLPLLMTNYLIETTAIIVMQIIFASMNADVVEDRSAENLGTRDEGLIFAARNFAKKAVSGLGVMLAGTLLWLVEFPDGALPGQVNDETVINLILVYLPLLLGLYLASWYAIRFYQIDESKHAANLAAMADSTQDEIFNQP